MRKKRIIRIKFWTQKRGAAAAFSSPLSAMIFDLHFFKEAIKMNITYTKKGDFYYPDLVYSKNDYPPLGKYGMLRKTYLKENFKAQYSLMLMNDTLWPHLLDIDKQAHDMMDTIVERMKQERGITEQLKADDWWRWVQEVGNIRNAAEEFVLREVVYA